MENEESSGLRFVLEAVRAGEAAGGDIERYCHILVKKLTELGTAIDHLRGQIESIKLSEPHRAEEMTRYDFQLKEIKTKMVSLRYQMFKRKYL